MNSYILERVFYYITLVSEAIAIILCGLWYFHHDPTFELAALTFLIIGIVTMFARLFVVWRRV